MKKNSPMLIYGLLVVIVVAIFSYTHFAQVLTIKNVVCSSTEESCPDYVQAELNTLKGKSLFFTDVDQVGKKITEYVPSFSEFKVTKTFPGTLKFHFTAAKSMYVITHETQGSWVIDTAGMVIREPQESKSDQQLPRFIFASGMPITLNFGQKIPPLLHTRLTDLIATLETQQIAYSSVRVLSQDDAEITLQDKKVVRFSLENVQLSFAKLEYLLSQMNSLQIKEPVKGIDLRFQHAVIQVQQNTSPQ